MKIFYCVRSLEAIPSCMYNIQMLCDGDFEVVPVIGRSTQSLDKIFASRGLKYISTVNKGSKNKYINHFQLTSQYRKNIKTALKEYTDEDLIIFGTADSAIRVMQLLKNKNYVLCLKELHENPWYFPILLKKLSKRAKGIICCEKNRSRIIQFRWGLKKRPYTITNKPYGYQTERYLEPTTDQTKELVEKIKDKKVIVYQARHIHFAEELINLAKALKKLNSDITLVLIGTVDHPEDREKIDGIYGNTVWTGHISAPMHLEITSYAKIGVAVYAENSLNNMFCAPNKTFEYAGFGIPSLCNDVPGLVESIGMSGAGKCVDWSNVDEIKMAIDDILSDYDEYSERAKSFYESEDNATAIKEIVNEILREMK
ncbi:MAG: glycosyltransferase [Clostridia bacterium]|nr:glycosyltransferase [Clostridia bacterium]